MEIATKQDLEQWKEAIIDEIRQLLNNPENKQNKQWIKTKEARQILNCSAGTLDSLKSKLGWTKVGGTVYWDYNSILALMEENRRN